MTENIFINEERPHDSASKHVSGHAIYTDDIKEPYGTLHGAIGYSKKAHAIIKKYYPDFTAILKRYGSVQIRNVGTIAGNIATASPIGDTLPLLL